MPGTGMNFDVFGVNVRLEYDERADSELKSDVQRAWSGASAAPGPGDVQVSPPTIDHDQFMEKLSSETTLAALEHRAGELMMFHAAGIAAADGRVAAFIGPSGRGKTTLSRSLAKHFSYVSDETIAVDTDLTVLPYRKPLSIKRDGKPKKQVSPSEEGLGELPDAPLRLKKLVVLDRREGVEDPYLEPVTLHEAFATIVPETSYLTRMHRPLMRFAEICEQTGGVVRVVYSDAPTLIEVAESLFDLPAEPVPWEAAADPRTVETVDAANAPVGALQVSEAIDALETGEHLVVLTADGVLRILTGIAPEIWRVAWRGGSLEDAVEAVVSLYGAPPNGDPRVIIEAVVNELVEGGALARSRYQEDEPTT